MRFRCAERDLAGRQCRLKAEHVGQVPCRFVETWHVADFRDVVSSGKPAKAKTKRTAKYLRQPELEEMHFSIPLVPPSVNHYKIPIRRGTRTTFVLTKEARAFQSAVGCLTSGSVRADRYFITVTVWLGFGQRGDADNFNKVVLDALEKAGIITSDAKVKNINTYVERDKDRPRTEVDILKGIT